MCFTTICVNVKVGLRIINLSFADEWIWGGCGDNMQYGYKWAATSAPRLRFQKRIINNWLLICSELDFNLAQILIFQICSKLHRHPRARGKGEGDWFSEIGKVSEKMVFAYSSGKKKLSVTKTKDGDKKAKRQKRRQKEKRLVIRDREGEQDIGFWLCPVANIFYEIIKRKRGQKNKRKEGAWQISFCILRLVLRDREGEQDIGFRLR